MGSSTSAGQQTVLGEIHCHKDMMDHETGGQGLRIFGRSYNVYIYVYDS